MKAFDNIKQKLALFKRKYYINELIKGCVLFLSLGLLYLLFTLFVEYLFWLTPVYRAVLFWLFILVEIFLLFRFIVIPIFKIIGLQKGISYIEASKIIGEHFPEVSDKLINVIQLKNEKQQSELLQASITQKSAQLQPIPFKKAISFAKNKKYLKYAFLPLFIWFLVYITGNLKPFGSSLNRVVNFSSYYSPPAPFSFKITNSNLVVLEGESLLLSIEVVGKTLPDNVKIVYNNQSFYLKSTATGFFEYEFSTLTNNLSFHLEANKVISKPYQVKVIKTPLINQINLQLIYPSYTRKKTETIENSGNAIVQQGTLVKWSVATHQTDSLWWNSSSKRLNFKREKDNKFTFSKVVKNNTNYAISSSNQQLKNYENLSFFIETIADEYPTINVKSDIDSVSLPPVQFIGQLSDDYEVTKLNLVYFNAKEPTKKQIHPISISKGNLTNFYYVFPQGVQLEEGINYEVYFEVFDNDAVNGSKSTKSKTFYFYNKTSKEIEEEKLQDQKDAITKMVKTANEAKKKNTELDKLKKSLQKKDQLNWSDTQQLEELINRQKQYEKVFEKQIETLSRNFSEEPKSEKLKNKQEELKKRLEEIKELNKKNSLEKELEKIAQKIEKEDLLKKINKLTKSNKEKQLSLERMLELTRHYYVEKKAEQFQEKLKNLAKEQDKILKEKNTTKHQEELNQALEKLKKEAESLEKENEKLKKPIALPEMESEMLNINYDMQKALDNLKQNKIQEAKKSQKSAANKMRELANKMKSNMEAMEAEEIEENIEDLRKIVENLIEFSFQQEDLLTQFSAIDAQHAKYPNYLKQQQVLKEYFEHIDDSLYVLSLRVPKISSFIQKEVSDVHYYIDKSITELSDNKLSLGVSNQQFSMTGANNLAAELSNVLDAMMNAQISFKDGKGKNSFSLPQIIEKQGEMLQEMRNKLKGKKQGERQEDDEGENQDIYEMYQQQAKLREMLQELLNKNGNKQGNEASQKMEEIEKLLLKEGFTNAIEKKMLQLNYELLKLQKAKKEQGEDKERKAKENKIEYHRHIKNKLNYDKIFKNNTEILKRQSLPLQPIYKKKVQQYFKLNPNDSI